MRTIDEVITDYEDLWRQAALEDRRQFFTAVAGGTWRSVRGTHDPIVCAFVIAPCSLQDQTDIPVAWICPEDGHTAPTLGCVMIHMNNAHHWTWDMLSNKFREALQEGLATSS